MKNIVAVTACTAGIAHTYMAAESLEKAAKDMGYTIKVETDGSIGVENELTANEIANADFVIIASDIEIDKERFAGKRLYATSSKEAIDDSKKLIEKADKEAIIYNDKVAKVGNITIGNDKNNSLFFKHVMNGISYMIPMVVASGIILSIANLFAFQPDEMGRLTQWGFDNSTPLGALMEKLFSVGQTGFMLMIPLFAGFTAKSIGDKPAIAPAMIGASLANDPEFLGTDGAGGGFISAIIIAFIVGYMVKYLRKIPWPKLVQPVVPIMIIPLIATLVISLTVIYIIGQPMALLMEKMYSGLQFVTENYSGAPILIGALLGAMIGFDLGGPVNKTALVFGTTVFTDTLSRFGVGGANFVPQTATQAAISVAPLGVWLATVLFKDKFTNDEKHLANTAFGMGLVGVTEGAIPFVAKEPVKMIIANVIGSAVAGGAIAATGSKFYGGIGSPLGTFIGYIEQPIPFITWIACVGAGILVTALLIGLFRSNDKESKNIEGQGNG